MIKSFYLFRFYRLSDRLILNNALDTEMGSSDIDSAMRSILCLCVLTCSVQLMSVLGRSIPLYSSRYFRAITEYMQQLRHSLGELRDDIEYDLPHGWNLKKISLPGQWLRRSWTLLMQKRSLASQSFPSLGGLLHMIVYNVCCRSVISTLHDIEIFSLIFDIWHSHISVWSLFSSTFLSRMLSPWYGFVASSCVELMF